MAHNKDVLVNGNNIQAFNPNDPYLSPELLAIVNASLNNNNNIPSAPQKWDWISQDLYSLGMSFFFMKYLIPDS
jgi:hypothetical protein